MKRGVRVAVYGATDLAPLRTHRGVVRAKDRAAADGEIRLISGKGLMAGFVHKNQKPVVANLQLWRFGGPLSIFHGIHQPPAVVEAMDPPKCEVVEDAATLRVRGTRSGAGSRSGPCASSGGSTVHIILATWLVISQGRMTSDGHVTTTTASAAPLPTILLGLSIEGGLIRESGGDLAPNVDQAPVNGSRAPARYSCRGRCLHPGYRNAHRWAS